MKTLNKLQYMANMNYLQTLFQMYWNSAKMQANITAPSRGIIILRLNHVGYAGIFLGTELALRIVAKGGLL